MKSIICALLFIIVSCQINDENKPKSENYSAPINDEDFAKYSYLIKCFKAGGGPPISFGNGFFIEKNGKLYFLTNHHVIQGIYKLSVEIPNSKNDYVIYPNTTSEADYSAFSPKVDLSIFLINRPKPGVEINPINSLIDPYVSRDTNYIFFSYSFYPIIDKNDSTNLLVKQHKIVSHILTDSGRLKKHLQFDSTKMPFKIALQMVERGTIFLDSFWHEGSSGSPLFFKYKSGNVNRVKLAGVISAGSEKSNLTVAVPVNLLFQFIQASKQ